MKNRLFYFLFVFILLNIYLSLAATNTCSDGIDNDADGDVDTDDVGCLDSSDVSERVYGYQIALDTSVDASCLTQLQDSSVGCVGEHYEEFSWVISFSDPTAFSSCLESYSSSFFDLRYDSSLPYTQIAVADCVYQHYDEFNSTVDSMYTALDSSTKSIVESLCLKSYYDEYSSGCEDEESLLAAGSSCEDNSECISGFCEVGECAECSLDEHCDSGEICDSNVCVSDGSDSNEEESAGVVNGDFCNTGEDSECVSEHCSIDYLCVGCEELEGDCGIYTCNTEVGVQTCYSSCDSSDNCISGYVCESGICVESASATDEEGSTASLLSLNEDCSSNEECESGLCDQVCIECIEDSSCSGGYGCNTDAAPNVCYDYCINDEDCASGYTCERGTGTCVESASATEEETVVEESSIEEEIACVDFDCSPYVCDESTDTCYIFCGDIEDAACTEGYMCSRANICEQDSDDDGWVDIYEGNLGEDCDSGEDAECAEGYCFGNTCSECSSESNCDSGEICDTGTCVDSASTVCDGHEVCHEYTSSSTDLCLFGICQELFAAGESCLEDYYCESGSCSLEGVCEESASAPAAAPAFAPAEEEDRNVVVRFFNWLFTFEWNGREKFISQGN